MANKRGNYFNYLRDPIIPVPHSTLQSREQQRVDDEEERNNVNREVDPIIENIEMNIGDIDDTIQLNASSNDDSDNVDNISVENGELNENLNEILNGPEINEMCPDVIDNDVEDDNEEEQVEESNYADINAEVNVILNVDNDNEAVQVQINEEVRQPIFEGVSLTKEESDLLIMSYVVRHSLSDVALEDLLELINCHLPEKLNYSKYRFLKRYPKLSELKSFFTVRIV
ncbi:uncharacterized protein LOC103316743 [Nasonia vitripennis]|uniref:Uncharacterized protein n=1 Tax=Nasonia vitripennis TaxID=7425 RepID=A0A7M7Q7G4_NASVI|nr:uncharacterized protein LOC103316743 [Nasonia vitripennis]